jgi:uncharacterized protein (DUF305 family)
MLIAAALVLVAQFHEPTAVALGDDVGVQMCTGAGSATPVRTAFDAEMAQVIARMHETMDVAPTGDPDGDFMRMMIPHHQGAIDMALVVLKHGHDERLKRLAQSIIVEQGQEITYMRTLLGAPPVEDAASR